MIRQRPFGLFALGLAAFAVVVALSLPLTLTAVPGGLGDHQSAATAAEVDRIQQAWRAGGVEPLARIAMLADLVFIGVFGFGCMRAGGALRSDEGKVARAAGWLAIVAGALFLLLDYAETIPEIIQLLRFAGDDTMAAIAAFAQPPKIAAFLVALVSVFIGLLARRRNARSA